MAWFKRMDPNQEAEEYRRLMEVPDRFEDGFTKRSVVGVLFVAFIMIPGNIYLGLMVGGNLGASGSVSYRSQKSQESRKIILKMTFQSKVHNIFS